MWIVDLKIFLGFCIWSALAYQGSKQDYIKWRERFLPKRPAPSPTTTTTESALVTSANDIYYENLKLRHHSRFPNLDRVLLKIDNMHQTGKKKNEAVQPIHNKIRHQNLHRTTTTTTTTTDEGLFGDDYSDLEYEDENNDDLNEYDDWVSVIRFIRYLSVFKFDCFVLSFNCQIRVINHSGRIPDTIQEKLFLR